MNRAKIASSLCVVVKLGQRIADHPGLWMAILLGAGLKTVILLTNSITFDADEAILALMARHILQGDWPLFFYGQSYMGALDAYLIAVAFLVGGQTVLMARLVQVALYLGVLVTTYMLTDRFSRNRTASTIAALLMAIPPVLFSLYTTSTLGDYVEILLINNLLFWIGWDILSGRKQSMSWWLLAGILAGLGWWSMALVVVSVVPLLTIGLWHFRKDMPWGRVGVLALGFVVGALPWIIGTLQRGAGATISDLSGAWFSVSGVDGAQGIGFRLLSLTLFNIPALFGLRPSWSVDWIVLPVGIIIAMLYLFVLWQAAQRVLVRGENVEVSSRLMLLSLLLGWLSLLLLFIFSPFGGDPTGRYLLPLYPLLAILVGDWLCRVRRSMGRTSRRWSKIIPIASLVVCLGYNLWGNVRSMLENPPGLTKQFDPISQIPHDHDQELIAFLDFIDADRGYSNTWVTFRFAFLTQERIIFSPRLPYKADMSYTYGDDRYPPYSQVVDEAEKVVYVTSNHPELDEEIGRRLGNLGVIFQENRIGPYTVFYDLSRCISPDDLGPFGKVTGRAIHSE
ncbi:MAG: glycosyltransferase family 39 protein [Anaerolineae bacterium]|nr:glycosyltransferase family 39 protein [Anaerolineae bacterium]